MREDSYLVIDEKVLPEVYQKVVQANALLAVSYTHLTLPTIA